LIVAGVAVLHRENMNLGKLYTTLTRAQEGQPPSVNLSLEDPLMELSLAIPRRLHCTIQFTRLVDESIGETHLDAAYDGTGSGLGAIDKGVGELDLVWSKLSNVKHADI
jgi:hypothetical protein